MGGRLTALKIIEENLCEDSIIDKRIASGSSSYKNIEENPEDRASPSKNKYKKDNKSVIKSFEDNKSNNKIPSKRIILKKKIKEEENSLLLWKKLKIENLIPKNKIASRELDTMFFKGELLKYANPKSQMSNQICYRKFFVLDRTYLS